MKRITIISLFIIVLSVIVSITLAQKDKLNSSASMESRWKKVEEYTQKQLPESALKEVEIIFEQAKKEKKPSQIIKAMIYKMRLKTDINPDETLSLLKEFETVGGNTADPTEKAIINAMTANLYYSYYRNNRWDIDRRTELEGVVPEDIKEWTKNIFKNKIIELLNASLFNVNMLQGSPALQYADILTQGKDSRILQPTLYDFLVNRQIELLKNLNNEEDVSLKNQIIACYDQLINFNAKRENIPATVYAQLEKFEYEQFEEEEYYSKLNSLEQKYNNHEAVVEVLAKKGQYLLDTYNETEEGNANKKKAYDIAEEGINKYPNYSRIGLLKNIQKTILQKNIEITTKSAVKPHEKLNISIVTRNVDMLQMSVYKVNATALEYLSHKFNVGGDEGKLYPKRVLIETKVVPIAKNTLFNETDTTVSIETSDYGIYELLVEESGTSKISEKSVVGFTVTDLAVIFSPNSGMERSLDIRCYTPDRTTGEPYGDVTIQNYAPKWNGKKYDLNFVGNSFSDVEKQYSVSLGNSNEFAVFQRGKDKFFTSNTYRYWYGNTEQRDTKMQVSLFTDRSLYRPGQTVYFKGIAYISNKKQQKVIKNKQFDVNLFNVNNEIVETKKMVSNDFGSFSGEFVLPESGLNGAYRLETGENSINLWVEEYKRPTFEVALTRPKNETRFSEEVVVKGNAAAYAGYYINGADVKYRVVRRTHRFCWWINQIDKIIVSGTTKSDADGNFEVKFTPEKDKSIALDIPLRIKNEDKGAFYTYYIYADVTDSKGETQQGEQTMSVGDKALFIIAQMPGKADKNDALKLDVVTQTLNGETVYSDMEYKIVSLKSAEKYYENTDGKTIWEENKIVVSGRFNTKDKLILDLKKNLSGMYKIIFTTKDNRENEVKYESNFILYDTKEKKPPVKTYKWLLPEKTEVGVGESGVVRFGTSAKNVFVLYEVLDGDEIIEKRWVKMTDEIKTFELPFKSDYGGGVTMRFTFVKDEQFFTETVQIIRKVEEKKLTPTVSVFRDKLQPGEKAEWTIAVPEIKADSKKGEVMTSMYDASLDALRPHSWYFNPTYREWVKPIPQWTVEGFDSKSDNAWIQINGFDRVESIQLDKFNWFGLNLGGDNRYKERQMRIRGVSSLDGNKIAMEEDVSLLEDAATVEFGAASMQDKVVAVQKEMKSAPTNSLVVEGGEQSQEKPTLRTNFNETAFFYPQLRTDDEGNVKVNFTAPESLTKWHLKMLAHTEDLFFGQNEAFAVTQKELMVQMNLPRFVRHSDKLTLSANVVNLSDATLSPKVKLEVINPENNQAIPINNSEKQIDNIIVKATKSVEWELPELKDYDLVIVKITAQTEHFSDGEQKYLPILPDKVLVTESQTITLRAGQTRTFTFENFIRNFQKTDTKNFTVEYAGNPAWYAVQALPAIAEPILNNAIDYLTAYYANTLAGYIANANPQLKSTFDKWKNRDKNVLMSNLDKNQELKNMLLEETPWVAEAKDETEQKRRIALLFDLNQQQYKSKTNLEKLLQLQTSDGGFAWFEGMPENRYITQEIALNLARLHKITKQNIATDKAIFESMKRALNYLDLQIANDFFELKKRDKDYQKHQTINELQLFYLHVRSEYSQFPVAENATDAVKYYTTQSEKYWHDWTLYGKAMMATVAYRNGKTGVAEEILASIRENAMKTDELGMYWAKNTGDWWWYKRPIATQIAIMEAFDEIRKAGGDVDEMKIWLLKQKQTQRWDSPISTLDAIYALLNYGTDWLSNQGNAIIMLGNTKLNTADKAETGTAYLKESIPTENLKSDMGKITVQSKSTSGISWGAAYWQYYVDADKVQTQGKEMKIEKSLFVEQVGNLKKSMIPINKTSLKKGDKVIARLVVTTDRDLEFVAMKDMRAACFEPVNQLSGCVWKEGTVYYQTTKDATTQFFFQYLPKGTYVFEYELWVNNTGTYSSGMAEIQCQYAPEFTAHSSGEKIEVE